MSFYCRGCEKDTADHYAGDFCPKTGVRMSKNCTFCDVDLASKPFGDPVLSAFGAKVKIGWQTLNLFDGKIKQDCRTIKFCPMCGRRL